MSEPEPTSDADRESEARWLDAARAGERAALERLIERYQGRIYRFGLKMCCDPDVAKDVVQDTLIAMARGVRDFRGGSSLSTWLYTIAGRRQEPAPSGAARRSRTGGAFLDGKGGPGVQDV